MKMNQESGIVDIWNIPKLRVHLDSSFCLEMIEKLKLFGNYPKIAGLINEPLDKKGSAYTIINFKLRKSAPVELVYKIGKLLSSKGFKKFHLSNIEHHIDGISVYGMEKSTIKNPKIPFDFTAESGCIFLAAILHDGGINTGFVPYYWNTDLELRKKVFKAVQDIFGVLPSKFNQNSESLQFPRVCGRILVHGLGLKAGNKIFTDPHIPDFIFKLPHEKISLFLRQAFDDDGAVILSNYVVRLSLSIRGDEKPPNLLVQVRELLQILDIKFTKPILVKRYIAERDGIMRSSWNISLTGRDDLDIFETKVNFSIIYKKRKLHKILTEVSERHFKWGKIEKYTMDAIKKLEKEHGYFTRNLAAKEIGRTWSRMQQIFQKLLKEEAIIEISEYSGTRPAKFKLRQS
jgi:hypothetical protein